MSNNHAAKGKVIVKVFLFSGFGVGEVKMMILMIEYHIMDLKKVI